MKIFIKTYGCRVNQVESEALLEEFLNQGYEITQDFKDASLCFINTCSVTSNADKEAEKFIRTLLKQNPSAQIVVSGCFARVKKDYLLQKYPTLKIYFKEDLSKALFNKEIDWSVKEHAGHSRAFIKIQDGCDCSCSYCIVPYTRPIKTSKPKEIVLSEIKNLLANNYSEIVLTGINIGNYSCPKTKANLADLCSEIFALPGNFRVRFSSIELNTISDDLIDVLSKAGEKFCSYLHLPLQSGSTKVLKDMRRHYTSEEFLARLNYIRTKIKDLFVYTDIIAGFPTETEEDFKISAEFLKKAKFAGLHVFSYSAREGTPAAKIAQLAPQIIKERSLILHALDKELRANAAATLKGQILQVIGEDFQDSYLRATASNFQRVLIKTDKKPQGLFNVLVEEVKGEEAFGPILK
ncbi:MAG: tRNA (N(6)-L-threonylcarbamoyladenosine(37)-C(2))-methylthiotransferase MtaB [Elusimicrobiaceae bacterium]|nr:tRNA (N(6)-L-threonylcarbamoyladenosine(37)-C(2))-methylthiotransferase MtaB [Elusimicrobiaceae bacterium]